MIVVGLTGNYGSGKSAVAGMFRDLGALTMDTDDIVRGLLSEPVVIEEIKQLFGEEAVVGGGVNKQWLAAKVFSDAFSRLALEDLIHPLVFEKLNQALRSINPEDKMVVIIEAPVIFERGHQSKFDKIITIYVPEAVNMQRLLDKDVSEADAAMRLRSQLPVEIKMRGSDFVIDNSKDLQGTREQVRMVYQELLSGERKHGNN
jgi:dephospho-CoA kinase